MTVEEFEADLKELEESWDKRSSLDDICECIEELEGVKLVREPVVEFEWVENEWKRKEDENDKK